MMFTGMGQHRPYEASECPQVDVANSLNFIISHVNCEVLTEYCLSGLQDMRSHKPFPLDKSTGYFIRILLT